MCGFLDPCRLEEVGAVDQAVQVMLAMHYRHLLHDGAPLPRFDETEFRAFSQNGEDGILHYLFAQSVAIPYRPDFVVAHADYAGASLPAFVKLGKRKGYRLVGCQRLCFNAFFVRDGVGEDVLPEVPAAACFGHPGAQYMIAHPPRPAAEGEWVEV